MGQGGRVCDGTPSEKNGCCVCRQAHMMSQSIAYTSCTRLPPKKKIPHRQRYVVMITIHHIVPIICSRARHTRRCPLTTKGRPTVQQPSGMHTDVSRVMLALGHKHPRPRVVVVQSTCYTTDTRAIVMIRPPIAI